MVKLPKLRCRWNAFPPQPYVVTPKEVNDRWGDRVFVHTHGGAWVFGGGDSALREAVWAASGLGVKVVSVDYRRPPLHPFPAAVDDAVAAWQEVIKDQDAAGTALFGTSAGGNIALATVIKLKELGLPLPGAVFVGTPATDKRVIFVRFTPETHRNISEGQRGTFDPTRTLPACVLGSFGMGQRID